MSEGRIETEWRRAEWMCQYVDRETQAHNEKERDGSRVR